MVGDNDLKVININHKTIKKETTNIMIKIKIIIEIEAKKNILT